MKLNDDDVLRLFQLRLADRGRWTLKGLAAEFGVCFMYVQDVLKGRKRADAHPDHPDRWRCVCQELKGVERINHKLRRHPAAMTNAVALYRKGHSLRAAARLAKVGHSTLHRELQKLGAKLRSPNERSPAERERNR